jgi:hypothetical protein
MVNSIRDFKISGPVISYEYPTHIIDMIIMSGLVTRTSPELQDQKDPHAVHLTGIKYKNWS